MSAESFYFEPYAKGMAVFLGPTEAKLMELAWEKKSLTVKKAMFYLRDDKDKAYTTVMTILSRLADKGLLKKEKSGRFFVYVPAVTKREYIKKRMKIITSCIKQFK